MKVKVFYPDPDGSIHFSKQELQALLDEVYREGYNDAKPYYWNTPSITWTNRGLNGITTAPYTYTTGSIGYDSTNVTTCSNNTWASGGDIIPPEPKKYQIKFENNQKSKSAKSAPAGED